MKAKTWNRVVIGGTVMLLSVIAGITAWVDPFLHYHAPLPSLQYPLKDERYQNDGIIRHYEYDALITGTSMTSNFKPSEMNELWGVNAVKTSYSGAGYHELCESIERAFSHQPDLKYVVCSLDSNFLMRDADEDEYTGYPDYLYDENPFNDVSYLLNKEVVPKTIAVLNYTRAGEKTPNRDEYGRWSQYMTYGKDAVLATTVELPRIDEEDVFTEAERAMVTENVTENFLAVAKAHPQTEFYLFFPPYSICNWEAVVKQKALKSCLQQEQLAVELLLEADNVHIFSFADRLDIIGDLNNYSDSLHYGEWINSELLQMMYEGTNELTKDNYKDYYEKVYQIYQEYEYEY